METARAPLSTDDSVSRSVVETIAEVEGVSPTELTPPLYEVVDPEALDDLFAASSPGRVEFSYKSYEVTVDGDGVVEVASAEA